MKINLENPKFNDLRKFQEGGEMPTEQPPVEEGAPAGGNPEDQIIQAAMQAVQTNDGQLALQVCQALVQMAGGGAPAEPQAPEGAEPVYRMGGRLKYWKTK